jgi:hypothetical protein
LRVSSIKENSDTGFDYAYRRVSQRLAALVPRPRLHLIRFGVRVTSLREVSVPPLREHGVLAPNAKWRSKVVPQAQDNAKSLNATQTATDYQEPPEHGRPMRLAKVRAQWLLAAAWPKQDTNPIKKSQLPKKRGVSAVCAPQGVFLLVPAVARV